MPSLDQDVEEVSRDTKRDANEIFDALVAGERQRAGKYQAGLCRSNGQLFQQQKRGFALRHR